ncbi:hypothetical protein J3A83DRAFT_4184655 [Scleroderma citrinum]
MDFHYDEAWCPVCDRQIMPKRTTIAVQQPPPPSPPPSASKDDKSRTKTAAGRVRCGGLLQGTGRVRPNGALKHTDSKTRTSPPQPQPQPTKQPMPPKLRTVIDQGPIPLYCSDECRMGDLNRLDGAYSIDFNPNRASPPLPPVPHNSFDGLVLCESEDESGCGSGSSLESRSSSSDSGPVSPSMATLAALYGFPPLPPPGPIVPIDGNPKGLEPEPRFNEYQGGIMMVSKRIEATLCSKSSNKQGSSFNTEPRKPIPGWTDGSHAWRESVYNFSPRPSSVITVGTEQKASFAASSHRGVQWTSTGNCMSGSSSSLPSNQSSDRPLPRSSQSYTDELYTKYNLPLARRSESRTTLFPPSSSYSSSSLPHLSSSSTSTTRRRRENPVIKASAEGRLLVPKVTLRAHSSSSQSVSSASLCSPLSRDTSELSEDSMSSDQRSSSDSAPNLQPPVSGRSWSYDNVRTYSVMMPRPKMEKRIETRMIEGEMKEVEVEVEIAQPLKPLFRFPGRETSRERRT